MAIMGLLDGYPVGRMSQSECLATMTRVMMQYRGEQRLLPDPWFVAIAVIGVSDRGHLFNPARLCASVAVVQGKAANAAK